MQSLKDLLSGLARHPLDTGAALSDDVHIVSDGIFRDGVRLVLRRILLMFR